MATPNADAAKGPLMLARMQQVQDDAFLAGVLYARLVRRGYRERAERALNLGDTQGVMEILESGDKPVRLF